MRAVRITDRGGPEVLALADVPAPEPGPEELLVRVAASAANRADLLQCKGLYPAPPGVPADIPGLEYSGEIVAVGSRVSRFKVGDAVMGIVGGGAFAELLVTHEREAVRVPSGVPLVEAAAIPEAFFTAFDAMVLQAGLRSGEQVLIHAVASGVGTAAIQLASALGATPIGTSRSPAKLERCMPLGLAHGIAVQPGAIRFADSVRALTGGRGADVVLDLVGGSYLDETLAATAQKGRVLLVGLLAGARAEVSLATLRGRRVHLVGTVLRSRPLEEKISVALAFERQLLPLFEGGRLRPVIDAVLPMSEAGDALRRLGRNETFGKLVLRWSDA